MGSTIHVIDIDEGKLLELSKSQVRRLPLDMTSLPCQAVRCDIGLVSKLVNLFVGLKFLKLKLHLFVNVCRIVLSCSTGHPS